MGSPLCCMLRYFSTDSIVVCRLVFSFVYLERSSLSMHPVVAFHCFAVFLLRLSRRLVVVSPEFGSLSILLVLLVAFEFLLLRIALVFFLGWFLILMLDFLGFDRFLYFLSFPLSSLMIL